MNVTPYTGRATRKDIKLKSWQLRRLLKCELYLKINLQEMTTVFYCRSHNYSLIGKSLIYLYLRIPKGTSS